MDQQKPRRAYGHRRRVIIGSAVAVAVLAAAAIGYGVVTGQFLTAPAGTPSPSSSTSDPEPAPSRTSAAPLPGPFVSATRNATPRETSDVIPPELEPAAPDEAVEAPDGMRVALTRIEHVQGQALQPGEVSGPAVRVTVTMTNGTKESINTSLVVVNAYIGAERRPAGTVIRPGGLPFSGPLAPGETTYGIYLFAIPEQDRTDVTITVDYQGAGATVVFSGNVG
jgi:hypothetical protein